MYYFAFKAAILSVFLGFFNPGYASSTVQAPSSEVQDIQHEWARLYYMDDFKNKDFRELQKLAQRANHLSHDNPDSAEALVWDAIVLSTLAEKKGGLGALSLVREAKVKLEQAEEINPEVLQGSIYASLGTLYAKVPGWPISFGSDAKAEQYFQKALALNPSGLDINYFYADYLAENGEQERALQHVDKALAAPTLDGRPVADSGRRAQVAKLRDLLQQP